METIKSILPKLKSDGIKLYFDKRVISIFVLGIAQGLPWVIIGSMLTLWLKESGVSRTDIGYAALIFSVYAINFLWSPIVDFTSPIYLSKIGRRKAWIVLCQISIATTCFFISALDPGIDTKNVVLLCLAIAIFSSTQDIAIDAYRVDSFISKEAKKVSAAAGAITAGWWTGYAGVGALPLFLSDMGWSWPQLYFLLGCVTIILALISAKLPKAKHTNLEPRKEALNTYKKLTSRINSSKKIALAALLTSPFIVIAWTIFGNETPNLPISIAVIVGLFVANGFVLSGINEWKYQQHDKPASTFDTVIAWVLSAVVAPLKDFFSRNGVKLALSLLLFIFLFKLGEAFLGRMSIVFYKEVGFTNTQIATYSKLLTWWLTVIFALAGGILNGKFGLVRGLMISGIAMAGTNLLFALLAIVGPAEKLYALAIVLDGFAAAWSSVAFVAFISLLCNHAFSATQYALMASLSNLGRTTISSTSGQVVDYLDGNWTLFFVLTTVMVIPSLFILWRLRYYITSLSEPPK